MDTRPLVIPDHEIRFQASRSSGPGGQHVNTSSSRVELRWNLRTTTALDPAERDRVVARLGRRVDADGWLRVVSAESRSQTRNREAARKRMVALVERARAVPRTRRATRVPRGEKEKRLVAKKRRSTVKHGRRRPAPDE
jgi:ribosome-associated protein